jgi:hypothetical protein
MRAIEFLPESWFSNLDSNHLSMAGYSPEPEEQRKREDLKSTVRDIRRQKAAKPTKSTRATY